MEYYGRHCPPSVKDSHGKVVREHVHVVQDGGKVRVNFHRVGDRGDGSLHWAIVKRRFWDDDSRFRAKIERAAKWSEYQGERTDRLWAAKEADKRARSARHAELLNRLNDR